MRFSLVLCLLAALAAPVRAQEPYPPPGFQRGGSAWCEQGHFLQVIYKRSPDASAGECQLWLESSNPELKPQRLLAYTNAISSFVDDSGNHLAIQHHETDNDELLYVFFRKPNAAFQRIPAELRAAAFQEFCRLNHANLGRADFAHLECVPDKWSEGGVLHAYLQGNSASKDKPFVLKPWYFLYDVEHQKFVPQNFPKNKDALVYSHQ